MRVGGTKRERNNTVIRGNVEQMEGAGLQITASLSYAGKRPKIRRVTESKEEKGYSVKAFQIKCNEEVLTCE